MHVVHWLVFRIKTSPSTYQRKEIHNHQSIRKLHENACILKWYFNKLLKIIYGKQGLQKYFTDQLGPKKQAFFQFTNFFCWNKIYKYKLLWNFRTKYPLQKPSYEKITHCLQFWMNMLWRNNMDLQKMLKQQIIMHTISYNFSHLQPTKNTVKITKTAIGMAYSIRHQITKIVSNLRILEFNETKVLWFSCLLSTDNKFAKEKKLVIILVKM